jgi:putative ABC transport system substrate-binding protein
MLGGAALWTVAGRAQEPERVRRVGVLIAFPGSSPFAQAFVAAFTQALRRLGWFAGKNIRIDYRFAAGDPALFKAYAGELVGLAPDAILASTAPALAALQQHTRTIPIVFVIVPDPVGRGLVTSLARPSGNITGFASYDASIIGKWAQLLKEAVPAVRRASIIFNPDTALAPPLDRVIEAAPTVGVTVTLAPVHDEAGIKEAIAAEAREPAGGLMILPDSFNVTHSDVIVAEAIRSKLPSIGWTELSRAGGLMSYWYDAAELHARAASYIDRPHFISPRNFDAVPHQAEIQRWVEVPPERRSGGGFTSDSPHGKHAIGSAVGRPLSQSARYEPVKIGKSLFQPA